MEAAGSSQAPVNNPPDYVALHLGRHNLYGVKVKGKAIPVTGREGP
jgi:hypothetical protein